VGAAERRALRKSGAVAPRRKARHARVLEEEQKRNPPRRRNHLRAAVREARERNLRLVAGRRRRPARVARRNKSEVGLRGSGTSGCMVPKWNRRGRRITGRLPVQTRRAATQPMDVELPLLFSRSPKIQKPRFASRLLYFRMKRARFAPNACLALRSDTARTTQSIARRDPPA
jgi:hypothetical protein